MACTCDMTFLVYIAVAAAAAAAAGAQFIGLPGFADCKPIAMCDAADQHCMDAHIDLALCLQMRAGSSGDRSDSAAAGTDDRDH